MAGPKIQYSLDNPLRSCDTVPVSIETHLWMTCGVQRGVLYV